MKILRPPLNRFLKAFIGEPEPLWKMKHSPSPFTFRRVTTESQRTVSHALRTLFRSSLEQRKRSRKTPLKKKKKKKKRLTQNVKAILSHFWLAFRSGRLFIFSSIWMLVGKRQYLQEIPLTTCSPNFSLATALVVKKEPSLAYRFLQL